MIRRSFLSFYSFFFSLLVFSSCSTSPKEILYNEDQCTDCKMIISDARFGAELVTKKGKIYKFDAIECMVRAVQNGSEPDYAHILVTHFSKPGLLQDAKNSIYLVNSTRPSPMGANLSAYESVDEINRSLTMQDARILTWDEILLTL